MIAVPTRDFLVLGQDFRTDKMLRADRLGGEDLGEVGRWVACSRAAIPASRAAWARTAGRGSSRAATPIAA
jgi:hypothetical protein